MTTDTTTIETALERLDHLTPDEIADFLRAAGIKGKRRDLCLCPIARYLYLETGRAVSVALTVAKVYHDEFLFDQDEDSSQYEVVDLPYGCYRFIQRLDRGGYGDLVEVD